MLSAMIPALKEKKSKGEKITSLTAYDALTAQILDASGIDIILVGDSVGNVLLGYESTLPVTIEDMAHHTKAVRKKTKNALLVADVPFISEENIDTLLFKYAKTLIDDAGADAVKIEGSRSLKIIKDLVKDNIPVMGHIGYTPQTDTSPKVKGKIKEESEGLILEAKKLEDAGVFSIVLELVEPETAKIITGSIKIPTIGIGSGPYCDGQILVTHDMVGLTQGKIPKFVKKYADMSNIFKEAVKSYITDVKRAEK